MVAVPRTSSKENRMKTASRRVGSILALAAVLLAAPALATEHRTSGEKIPLSVRAVDRALAGLWHELTRLFAATGSGIDPFGNPTPSTSATAYPQRPAGDNGSGLDPFDGH
jgi:hypothetical protein